MKRYSYDEPKLEIVLLEETVITASTWTQNGVMQDPDKDDFENMFQ